jgi:DNA polymerase/3'-5' exonuclease PolX
MENREVARVLRETAQLLEIDGAIIGRYRSYEKAAELIASLAESIEAIAIRKSSRSFPGSANAWPSTSAKFSPRETTGCAKSCCRNIR